jgi:hypothetical protein
MKKIKFNFNVLNFFKMICNHPGVMFLLFLVFLAYVIIDLNTASNFIYLSPDLNIVDFGNAVNKFYFLKDKEIVNKIWIVILFFIFIIFMFIYYIYIIIEDVNNLGVPGLLLTSIMFIICITMIYSANFGYFQYSKNNKNLVVNGKKARVLKTYNLNTKKYYYYDLKGKKLYSADSNFIYNCNFSKNKTLKCDKKVSSILTFVDKKEYAKTVNSIKSIINR